MSLQLPQIGDPLPIEWAPLLGVPWKVRVTVSKISQWGNFLPSSQMLRHDFYKGLEDVSFSRMVLGRSVFGPTFLHCTV